MKKVIPRMRKQTRYTNSKFLICKALVCFFFLFACATNQATDITKSANYKIGDYNVFMRSPEGYCINRSSQNLTKKSIQFFLTDCIDNASFKNLRRRPVSSIISVNIIYEPGLELFPNVSNLVKQAGGTKILQSVLNERGTKIRNSFMKNEVLFLSLEETSHQTGLNTGKKFWKALALRENILIIFTSYGFSQKASNNSAQIELEKKLKSITQAIKISKNDSEKSY